MEIHDIVDIMGKIIDRSKELYPNLEGAEVLEYKGEDVPEGVQIIKSNVFSGEDKDYCFKDLSHWGWDCEDGYHFSFSTPEAALNDYNKYLVRKLKANKKDITST